MRIRALVICASLAASLVVVSGASGTSGRAASASMTAKLGEFYFRPKVVTIRVGQKVRFLNVGKIEHTVADTDRRWHIRSKLIRPRPLAHGQAQTVRFTKPGTIYYLCTFHPTLMRGRIIVLAR